MKRLYNLIAAGGLAALLGCAHVDVAKAPAWLYNVPEKCAVGKAEKGTNAYLARLRAESAARRELALKYGQCKEKNGRKECVQVQRGVSFEFYDDGNNLYALGCMR
ncbi:MAG: hypothetical protein QXE64_02280 [Candidatus Pacearchaeota archaeon]